MISQKELTTISSASTDKLSTIGERLINNTIHGVTSGVAERKAIEAFLYDYAIKQHKLGKIQLTDPQLRHVYSRLREL